MIREFTAAAPLPSPSPLPPPGLGGGGAAAGASHCHRHEEEVKILYSQAGQEVDVGSSSENDIDPQDGAANQISVVSSVCTGEHKLDNIK